MRTTVGDMLRGMDRFGLSNTQVIAARIVAAELQNWIDNTSGLSEHPMVVLQVTSCTVSLSIGDLCVWDSDADNEDELTFACCKRQFKNYVANAALFFGKLTVRKDKPCQPAKRRSSKD